MDDRLIEAPVRDGVVAFDGRVLEVFALDMSLRWHLATMPRLEIDGDQLKFFLEDSGIRFWFFDESQRAGVEALVQAVPPA